MPVDQQALLSDCQDQLEYLEADLNAQAEADADLAARLRAEYALAREAGRVGDAYEIWRGEQATQSAVQWVLGGVFVRFLEDNGLLAEPLLAGEGDRGRLAEAAEQAFIAANPSLHERHWFLHVFRTVGRLPGASGLFDEAHNPVFHWPLTPEAAKRLLQFWRRTDPATGELAHDFADPEWDTRFLGDLYQELSESARKKYALLQTPIFVEEFILDRTLGEALQQLPLPEVTVIDPTCGSGHFLLGAFARLLAAWEQQEPGTPREALAQRALAQVAGVDLNPFAVATARFRLLMAALRASGVSRLDRAPAFRMNVAVGDSLLHGDEPGGLGLGDGGTGRFVGHAFSEEDLTDVRAILGRQYSVVVGNPPYIAVQDPALRTAYRERYSSCHGRYTLSVPFIQRFWELATDSTSGPTSGWVGMINSNAFAKREFGVKVVQEFLRSVDLTHVIDSSGASIPGHGTPTVILFGRNRAPVASVVRAAMGIRGEPGKPADPAAGLVWTAIVDQVDSPGSEGAYISVNDVERERFARHPWSIGGGGMAELKTALEQASSLTLGQLASAIGITAVTGEDDLFMLGSESMARRHRVESVAELVTGDGVRDWNASGHAAIWPYDDELRLRELADLPGIGAFLWPFRTLIAGRKRFGVPMVTRGASWYEYQELYKDKLRTPTAITFAFVATHNHFSLNTRGAVFNRSAPVIKLGAGHVDKASALLGALNSSVACFWMKQVMTGKHMGDGGEAHADPAYQRFEFASTQLASFPLPTQYEVLHAHAAELIDLASQREALRPRATSISGQVRKDHLVANHDEATRILARMIALQEELDWRCYSLYQVGVEDLSYRDSSGASLTPPPLRLGQRAFEILLARRLAAGEEETTWFQRHGSTPMTELPAEWPADYRVLVELRIAVLDSDRSIGLIERPEYKRRWSAEPWEEFEEEALRTWLLDRLEMPAYWPDIALQSTRDLAARAALDPDFGQVASVWAGAEGVELESAIRRLVLAEGVPALATFRYTDGGRQKRRLWERTWQLQREEDAVNTQVAASLTRASDESNQAHARRLAEEQTRRRAGQVGDIPRPPKYKREDFQSSILWGLRGALDVPRERFLLYPLANRDGDDAPIIGWAGWNHLQQAQALTAWYAERTERDGWTGERLIPLLAGMAELLPWLKQWHNEIDPEFGDRPGDAYESWLEGELQQQGLTRAALDVWEPPRAARRRGRRAAATQE